MATAEVKEPLFKGRLNPFVKMETVSPAKLPDLLLHRKKCSPMIVLSGDARQPGG